METVAACSYTVPLQQQGSGAQQYLAGRTTVQASTAYIHTIGAGAKPAWGTEIATILDVWGFLTMEPEYTEHVHILYMCACVLLTCARGRVLHHGKVEDSQLLIDRSTLKLYIVVYSYTKHCSSLPSCTPSD